MMLILILDINLFSKYSDIFGCFFNIVLGYEC